MINRYHNDLLVGYFDIKKIQKLVTRKYYWKTIYYNIKVYIRGYNIYLTFKAVKY